MALKIKRVLTGVISCILLIACVSPSASAIDAPQVNAAAVVVADLESGNILYEENMMQPRSPASLTKIITGMLAVEAIENGQILENDVIAAPNDCLSGLDEESSTADPAIQPGEQMRIIDVLYCALLHSANEACNILAVEIAGSIPNFVDMMNQRVRNLGAVDTRFYDTNGLLSDNTTTAYDLFRITSEAMKHPLFASIVNTEVYIVPTTNMTAESRTLHNSNALLTSNSVYGAQYRYDGISGVKTGYTDAAGYCLVSTCKKNGMNILCIVLGCNGWLNAKEETYGNFSESIKLYDWTFDNFEYKTILTQGDNVGIAEVKNAKDGKKAMLSAKETARFILPKDVTDDQITKETSLYEDKLTAPIKEGTEVGELKIAFNGKTCGSVPLICSNAIETDSKTVILAKLRELINIKWIRIILIPLLVVLIIYIAIRIKFKSIQKKHLIARAKAEEKRKKLRKEQESQNAKSREQAENWQKNIIQDNDVFPIKKVNPEDRKPVETDLDALIKSLGLGEDDKEKKS